jgi:hypothetical protein
MEILDYEYMNKYHIRNFNLSVDDKTLAPTININFYDGHIIKDGYTHVLGMMEIFPSLNEKVLEHHLQQRRLKILKLMKNDK